MALIPQIAAPGSAAVAPSFDAPLAMLAECHRRVERQCATLARLVPHLAAHGSDAPARDAAQAVLRYFDTAAVHHHADEEQDLFPALIEAMAGSDAVCLRQMSERVRTDHHALDRRWAALRRTLQTVAGGEPARLDAAEVQGFADAYAGHIAFEEAEVLPMAERLLDPSALQRIGDAMRRRRGLPGGGDAAVPVPRT